MKNEYHVLLTCCAMHVKERIDTIKNNEDGIPVKVYAVNNNIDNLPPAGLTDGQCVVPSIHNKAYIPTLLDLCKKWEIDLIIPTVTLELELMAKYKSTFEQHGIKVSVSSEESLFIANNKKRLHEKYHMFMPKQCEPKTMEDVYAFEDTLDEDARICVKLTNHCGGNGFAIVDDEKAYDVTLFNKYGENRYISHYDLAVLLDRGQEEMLVQEYIDGNDYSVCILADNGKVEATAGFIGYMMSFGAIVRGKMKRNNLAYIMAETITKELKLDGNVCFDFRIGNDGGVVLLEINPRVSASLPFVAAAGTNMLWMRCCKLLGLKTSIVPSVDYGLKMRKYYDTRYFL